MRSPRTLVVLLVVALGLVALPSLAAASEFEAESYPVEVLGAQEGKHVIGFEDKLALECSVATFKGEMEIWTETEEVSPVYGECVAFGFFATVTTNGCTYVLHAGEELVEPGDFEGTMDIKCPTGKKIVVTAGTCEVQVGGQEGLGKVEYEDLTEASPQEIELSTSLTKLKYSKVKDGFGCSLTGTGEKEDGTYSGTSKLSAEQEQEGGGLIQRAIAMAKAPNTKLCKKEPKPTCNEFFPAETELSGKRAAGGEQFRFALRETKSYNNAAKNIIRCDKSTFVAKTETEAGVPLKEIAMTFTENCKTQKGTACTVKMQNTAPKGFIRWSRLGMFSGALTVNTFDVLLECKGELKCEYVAAPLVFDFKGGTAATLTVGNGSWLTPTPTAGEENCWPYAVVTGPWELTPAGIWLVKV
jgi:hypothetical protein